MPHAGTSGDKDCAIHSLAIHPENPNVVYIGQNGTVSQLQALMKGTRDGDSWTWVSKSDDDNIWGSDIHPVRVKLSPGDPSVIWAIASVGYMYYSTNGGNSWNREDPWNNLAYNVFQMFSVSPSLTDDGKAAAAGQAYVPTNKAVAETEDGNETWEDEINDHGFRDMERDPTDEGILYGVSNKYQGPQNNHYGLFRSTQDDPSVWTWRSSLGNRKCHDISIVPYSDGS